MKSAMLIPLLLLSLLTHQAQGMGMIRKEDNSLWKSKHFSGIRARKLLITSPIPTTATIAKNENENKKKKKKKEKSATKEEKLSVNSSSTAEKRPTAADEAYPDILDLAGMDYSQARRKPPIHN